MKSMLKIFTILPLKQQRYCIFIVCCMLIGGVLEAIGIGAILPLISIMGNPSFLLEHENIARYVYSIGIESHIDFIIISAIGLIFIYIVKNIYMGWQTKLQIDFAMKNQIYYAGQLFAGYLRKPYRYHLENNSMTLLRNVNSGAVTVFTGILIPTLTVLTEVITAFTIWLMLVFVDAFTAVIVAGVLFGMMYSILGIFRHKILVQGIIQNECSAIQNKWLNQGLGSIKETKVLRREYFFNKEFNKAYASFGNANRKFNFINQLPRILIETIIVSGLLLLIIIKITFGDQPMDIVPLLGVLALAAFRLMPSANRIINLLNGIKFQMPLFDEIYEDLIDIKEQKINGNEDVFLSKNNKMDFSSEIKIENLVFSYSERSKPILNKLSFIIPKGSFVGIMGPSGAGKTTFVDILLGLLLPTSGRIFIDEIDLNENNIREWQANLAYVPQNIYLIDGTVRENIALGIAENEINDTKIDEVLKMAELYDFIKELPAKENTVVGERGVKISGGQRQRIGIARALYYDPEVLILDEATSALDAITEKSITSTILKLKGKITIIAIAHRMSTLTECDFKMKFKNGIAERVQ